MTPIAFDKDVLRLQTGDRWAWCHWSKVDVFRASAASSSAAPTIAHACMLCYGTLFVACRADGVGLPFMMAAPAIGSAGLPRARAMRLNASALILHDASALRTAVVSRTRFFLLLPSGLLALAKAAEPLFHA